MSSIIDTEIIRNGLNAAAVEMGNTLVRTAYNPLLYEVQDFGAAIVSPEGQLWAEGAGGVPPFLGCLPDTILGGREIRQQIGLNEGDFFLANDPFITGTHLSDVTVYTPVFFEGELLCFAGTTAHWADIGGKTPGGWCPDSTDVYQEGLCFRHHALIRRGVVDEQFLRFIETNVRFPVVVKGDLHAQIAAARQGETRIKALCHRFGADGIRNAMTEVIDRTDTAFRNVIRSMRDGMYRATIEMDGDGVDPDKRPVVSIAFEVVGDRITVSFDGSSEVAAGPINLPAIGTRAHVRAALKGLIMPHDAANHGHFRSMDISIAPNLVVSPERPAPSDCYGYVGTAIIYLTMKALSEAAPWQCPAGGYQLFSIYLHRVDPRAGQPFNFIDILAGGDGARPTDDGPTLIFAGAGDESNTPVEIVETRFPVRCHAYELNPAVAGAGKYVGGYGLRRDYEILEEGIYVQVSIENTRDSTARGVAGGHDGEASAVVVWPGSDRETWIREKTSFFGPLKVGDVVSARSGGGGGWGSPMERERTKILEDLQNGFLTELEAATTFGFSQNG
jgi:N-methylhydantoinase B